MTTNDELQQQLIKDLLIESFEGLDRFDREMLALEKGAGTAETPNVIFRVIHTIKGTAGCLGLTKIESVAHVGENLLSSLREGRVSVTPPFINALLAYADALREMLRSLETDGHEGGADYSELLRRLQDLNFETAAPTPSAPAVAPPAPPAKATWGLFDDEPAGEVPVPVPVTAVAGPTPSRNLSEPEPAAANGSGGSQVSVPSAADSAIRVNVDQLDKLMNLVGELVLARNQIVQHCGPAQDHGLLAASQRLNLITTELQEGVMKTRMQPIGNIWAKFPRVVRDVANELGKEVQLVMEGNQTELDRTIIEAIKDPLTHIVRNAIDHGIEEPAARRAAGKPDTGMLILRAFHEGGQVNIEIMDDGRGVNIGRVKQKAIEKGLVTVEQAGRLSDREALNLIFLPGFSTAEKVTNVSGRGVGMDVVKTNIEKIGGAVDLVSDTGRGSTVKIKIPLTLAIIPALIVTSGGERFAIPQVSLLELVRLEDDQKRKGIELLCGAPVYRLRGRLLPLCYLNQQLKLVPASPHQLSGDAAQADAVNVVVLQADGRQFGLIVDQINDTEEIVVKPLGKQLKGIACFAGATIMGDGRVALILDVLGLAQHAHIVSEVRDRAPVDKARTDQPGGDRQTLLLFDAGSSSRMAIPLSMVARLEEFPRKSVERSGDQEVIQYRGQIIPLIRVADHIASTGLPAGDFSDPMQVVIYAENGRSVGLVVGRIDDIVDEVIAVKRDSSGRGTLGSVVIKERITDLLDVSAIIRAADPAFYSDHPATLAA